MPNKTIYVREEDIPLFERMSLLADSSVSLSQRFADFLRFEESLARIAGGVVVPVIAFVAFCLFRNGDKEATDADLVACGIVMIVAELLYLAVILW